MKGATAGWDIIRDLAEQANPEPTDRELLERVRERAAGDVYEPLHDLLKDYGDTYELPNHVLWMTPPVPYIDRDGRTSYLAVAQWSSSLRQMEADAHDSSDWPYAISILAWVPSGGVYDEHVKLVNAGLDGSLRVYEEPEGHSLINHLKPIIRGIEADLKKLRPEVEDRKKAAKEAAKAAIDNRGEPL